MALFVDGTGPPPGSLSNLLNQRRWDLFPEGGGTLDQPAGELKRMAITAIIYDAWTVYRQRPPGWGRSSGYLWTVVLEIAYHLYMTGGVNEPAIRKMAWLHAKRKLDGETIDTSGGQG